MARRFSRFSNQGWRSRGRRRRRGGGGGHGAGEEEAVQGGGGGAGEEAAIEQGRRRRCREEEVRFGRHGSTGGRTNLDGRARRGRSECGVERLRLPDFLERPRSVSEENILRREPLRSMSLATKHLQK
ncbi:hypothetical protein GQ55_9G569600 [Panicum hallii var. hallii]|uniref:Uncharacterized protein n=1 Tax=Panicum hallii var. hallii TaxID=1504633 RepID=A0A2T7CG05_9POAL|nr:hypothetical protein GQ55_9G569600 [Panicum hallii var. hallii]